MGPMALKRRSLLGLRLSVGKVPVAGVLADLLLWGAIVALLELFRPFARGDGPDLVALAGLTFFGIAMGRAARAGLLPGTALLGRQIRRLSQRVVGALAPRYAVGFRASEGVRPLPDRALLAPVLIAGALAVAFTVAGNHIFEALLLLKTHVSYTLYLIPLAAIWALIGSVLVLGALAAAQWVAQVDAMPGSGFSTPRTMVAIAWVSGLIVLSLVPGIIAVGTVLTIGWWRYAELERRPRTPYLFCRRDAQRRPRVIPVDTFLSRGYLGFALILTAVSAIGITGRLFETGWPSGPFALTRAMGQLATLAAILLLLRAAAHLRRLTGGNQPPELPLIPTIWAPADSAPGTPWRAAAADKGFRVVEGTQPPPRGFDLLVGNDEHPQRLVPREGASRDDLGWQLLRRFHVVMRRRFNKRMKRLVGALRAADRRGGSGFLFCPHAWLVRGVVRDADVRSSGSGSLVGPGVVGPAYSQTFSPRLRRYLGGVLRDLGVDIVFWEDAIRWPDIKRVFGAAWEVYDQRRGPLTQRHFVGLPRVRVLVQEEAVEADPHPAIPYPTPSPGHVRVLVILRDRGGEEEEVAPAPPGEGVREPSLVGW